MFSAYYHLNKAVDFFIENGANLHKTNSLGWNALFLLAMNEKYKETCHTCCGWFLHKDTKSVYCELHFKMLRIAESLIDAGLDYNSKDVVGNTAKTYCKRIKNVPLYEYLHWIDGKKISNKKR